MSKGLHSYDCLWLSLALLPAVLVAMLLPLSPQDYWWYLRLGQEIQATGSIPVRDTFSYTQAGMPYVYHAWLAGVVYWKVYQSGEVVATFLLRGVVIACTYAFVWLTARSAGAGPRMASLLTILAALVGSGNWSFRPQLLVYPLFALAVLALYRWQEGKSRAVWVYPLLAVLWVNLHGSYPLILVLGCLALAFGCGDRKASASALIAAGLAIFVNPRGWQALDYVASMLTDPSNRLSIEWSPPINRGWQANLFFGWLLVLAPLAALSKRRAHRLEWALFLGFGWLALSGVRYVIWFSFLLAPLTATLLADWDIRAIDRPIQRARAPINLPACLLLFLLPYAALPGVREAWWPGAPDPFDRSNPIGATRWLAAHPDLEGPLFSDLGHSSYLIFALPSRPVWIDPRFELYPVEQWERYAEIMSASSAWQPSLDEEGIQIAMLSVPGEPELIAAMRASARWCQAYADADAIVFLRTGACP